MLINGKEIKIDRRKVKLSEIDITYGELVEEILKNGIRTTNRTGIDTISIAGWSHKFDIGNNFPIMETKEVKAEKLASEIQWIYIAQDNHPSWLRERNNNIWNQWEIDFDGIYREYEQGENAIDDPEREVILVKKEYAKTGNIIEVPLLDKYGNVIKIKSKDVMDKLGNPRTIKKATYFGEKYTGTIGEAYGFINHTYKRPQAVEWTLKNDPFDRRMNVSLWQDAHIINAVLPSCVWSIEFKVTPDGVLNAFVHQRSADIPVGLPFNIPQYALLVYMYAKAAGLKPGTMSWSIMDAHIYVNQLTQIKKQLKRYKTMLNQIDIIQNSSDPDVEKYYDNLVAKFNNIHSLAALQIDSYIRNDFNYIKNGKQLYINDLTMKQRLNILRNQGYTELATNYENAYEEKMCFEHLLTRDDPVLELANHDSIFEYSTDYVNNKDPYLKENPIGNKELVLKKYTSAPFISMPVAQ